MKNCTFCKHISIFLLGIIIGYLIKSFLMVAPSIPIPEIITTDGSIKTMGQEDAPITITEYSDFQCPLCKKYFDETFETIVNEYVNTGKVKYVFKHFPLNIHPEAVPSAIASECALEQNKFWEMHDELFRNQSNWSGKTDHISTFKAYAKNIDLNQEQFDKCIDKKKYLGNVNKDYEESLNKNVRGTPTLYINDQVIVGAQNTSQFTKVIDDILTPTEIEE